MTNTAQATEGNVEAATESVLGNTASEVTESTQGVEQQPDFVTDESILPTEDKSAEYSWVHDKFKGDNGQFDADKAAKSYAELTKKLSDKNMLAPENAADYEITLSENTMLNEEAVSETRELFKEMGVPNSLAQPLVQLYEQRVAEVMEMVNSKLAEAEGPKFNANETRTTLKEEWGNSFDANLTNANKAISTFFDGDISEYGELVNNPAFAKFAAKVGAQLNEDSAPSSTQVRTHLSEDEVDELMQREDYWDSSSSTYKKVQAYFNQK